MTVLKFPLHGLEDTLVNIGALTKFGLFRLENSDPDEMARMKSDLVTLLYLIKDQSDLAETNFSAHVHRQRGKGYE